MLIQKPFEKNDIVSLKLSTGEEVVARFDSKTATSTKILKPMAFMMGPQGLGLVPFVFSADRDTVLEVGNEFIIVATKTDGDVAKQYMQQTTNLAVL